MSIKHTISGAPRKEILFIGIPALIIILFATFASVQHVGKSSIPQKSTHGPALAFEGKKNNAIVPGAERLNTIIPALSRKSVAVVVNATSMVNRVRLIDTLKSRGVNLKKIFCPEHGCQGKTDAGEIVSNTVDKKTGLPIVSLYGQTKKPTRQQLADIDIVIFDIQDVGARFYTYISTLQYVMEACAENQKTVMVLDRPNPNGEYIDGPILEPEFKSFVGLNPIPIVHGMTIGEMANMINGEGWMTGGIKVHLEIVSMLNYTHKTPYIPPIAPSPNLPTYNAIKWYPSLCLFEGTAMSVGRGTYFPFEVVGSPELADSFSFQFTPKSIPGMAKTPKYQGKTCYGINLQDTPPSPGFHLKPLIQLFNAYPDKDTFFNSFFNKLAGNRTLQAQIKRRATEQEIKASWKKGIEEFRKKRAQYLLYID